MRLSPAFAVVVELGIGGREELWVIFDVNECISITISHSHTTWRSWNSVTMTVIWVSLSLGSVYQTQYRADRALKVWPILMVSNVQLYLLIPATIR